MYQNKIKIEINILMLIVMIFLIYPVVASSITARHTFVEIDHEIIYTVISPPFR